MDGDRKNPFENFRASSFTPLSFFAATVMLFFILLTHLGCGGSKQSNFYLLHPPTPFFPSGVNPYMLDAAIGIGPISIPGYLNRPQIVTRSGMYEVEVSEYDRWADTLDESVPKVMAENLSSILSTDRVYTYPWYVDAPDYQVRMEIIRFDARIPGNVELVTRWTLFKNGSEIIVNHKRYNDRKPIAGQGYSGMVSTMNLVLYDMSREIADAIIQDAREENTGRSD